MSSTALAQIAHAQLGIPVPLAYGYVRARGNELVNYQLADGSTIVFAFLGEGEWDGLDRFWLNKALANFADTSWFHFHPGTQGVLGSGIVPASSGGDQGVDLFFNELPPNVPRLPFSLKAYFAMKVTPDPSAPSGQIDWVGDYRARKVRIFDATGTQTGYAFSTNPAWQRLDLILRCQVKREGLPNEALTADEKACFDWPSIKDAADFFDQLVSIDGANQKRVETSVAFTMQQPLATMLAQFDVMADMFQREVWGKIQFIPERARASTFTLLGRHVRPGSIAPGKKKLRGRQNRYVGGYNDLNAKKLVGVLSIARSGGVVTAETTLDGSTPGSHPFLANDNVDVYGVPDASFDGSFMVTDVPDSTHVTWSQAGADATSAGGSLGMPEGRFAQDAPVFSHDQHQLAVGQRGLDLAVLPSPRDLTLDFGNNTVERVKRIMRNRAQRMLGMNVSPYLAPREFDVVAHEDAIDDAGNALLEQLIGDRITVDKTVSEEWAGEYVIVEPTHTPLSGDGQNGDEGTVGLALREYIPGSYDDTAGDAQVTQAMPARTPMIGGVVASGADFGGSPATRADLASGGDVGAKILAALAVTPPGGMIDATGFPDAALWSTPVNLTGKHVRLSFSGRYRVSATPMLTLDDGCQIIGAGVVDADLSTAKATSFEAIADNLTIISIPGTFNGSTGRWISTCVIRDINVDGQGHANIKALEAIATPRLIVDNFTAQNCGATGTNVSAIKIQGVQDASIGVLRVSNCISSAPAVHILDNGLGVGNANLAIDRIIIGACGDPAAHGVAYNGSNAVASLNSADGDALLIEGGGACIEIDEVDCIQNQGAGIRIRHQASSGTSPWKVVIRTATLETNGNNNPAIAKAALCLEGASGDALTGAFVENLIVNGENQFGQLAAPRAVWAQYAKNLRLQNCSFTGAQYAVRFEKDGLGNDTCFDVVIDQAQSPAITDTTFYDDTGATASTRVVVLSTCQKEHALTTTEFLYANLSYDASAGKPFGLRAGGLLTDPRIIMSSSADASGVNAVSNAGGIGLSINDNVSAQVRIGKTADGANWTRLATVDYKGNLSLGGSDPACNVLGRLGYDVQVDRVVGIPSLLLIDKNAGDPHKFALDVSRSGVGVFAIYDVLANKDRLTVDTAGLVDVPGIFALGHDSGANAPLYSFGPDTGRIGNDAVRMWPSFGNRQSYLTLMPGGSSTTSGLRLYNGSDPANVGSADFSLAGTVFGLTAAAFGTGTAPTVFAVTGMAINTTVGYRVGAAAPARHYLIGDGTNYADGVPAYGDLTGTPTLPATTAAVAHKFFTAYDAATGAFTQAQPDYSDLTGTPTLPANTGAVAHKFLTAYNSSTGAFTLAQPAAADLSDGVTGSGSVVMSTSPVFAGSIALTSAGGSKSFLTVHDTAPSADILVDLIGDGIGSGSYFLKARDGATVYASIRGDGLINAVAYAVGGTAGLTSSQTFKDGSGATKNMTISGGIITAIA